MTEGNNRFFSESTNMTKTDCQVCKICGTSPSYSNFGAVVCSACRTFFKRNAEKGQLTCDWNANCEINLNTRHVCTACRLAKCLANGMQTELIRGPISTKRKKIKMTTNSTIPTTNALIPTLNLLRSDQSTLSSDQWNHISNLVHCYDEYGPFSIVGRFVSEQNVLPFKLRYKSGPVSDIYLSIFTHVQQIYKHNDDFRSLCLQDRSTLIQTTIKYATGFGAVIVLQEKKLYDDPIFFKTNELIFGNDALVIAKRIVYHLDDDTIFLKLIIGVLSFSTINHTAFENIEMINFIDIKTILRIQDTYIELAWKYFVYKYGEKPAVIRFNQLLRCLFCIHQSIVEVNTTKQYTNILVNAVLKQTVISDQ